MKREKVESSNIKSIGYDPKKQILEIEFVAKKGQSIYQYYNIPENIYCELMESESIGVGFGQLIRNVYDYKRKLFVVAKNKEGEKYIKCLKCGHKEYDSEFIKSRFCPPCGKYHAEEIKEV